MVVSGMSRCKGYMDWCHSHGSDQVFKLPLTQFQGVSFTSVYFYLVFEDHNYDVFFSSTGTKCVLMP